METFIERKKAYIEKLRANPDVLYKIEQDYGDGKNEKDLRTYQILIAPCDERELSLAESMYSVLDDINTLFDKYSDGVLNEYQPKDNGAINMLVTIMKKLMNGETVNIDDVVDKTVPTAARYMVDFIRGFVFDPDDTIEYMAQEVGLDYEDEFEASQFGLYFAKATELLGTGTAKFQIEGFEDDEARLMNEYAKEFHNVCEECYVLEKPKTYRRSYDTYVNFKFNFNIKQ